MQFAMVHPQQMRDITGRRKEIEMKPNRKSRMAHAKSLGISWQEYQKLNRRVQHARGLEARAAALTPQQAREALASWARMGGVLPEMETMDGRPFDLNNGATAPYGPNFTVAPPRRAPRTGTI